MNKIIRFYSDSIIKLFYPLVYTYKKRLRNNKGAAEGVQHDMVHTLTFSPDSVGVDTFSLYLCKGYNPSFGSKVPIVGKAYYRNKKAGPWKEIDVAVSPKTEIPITSATMQVAHSFNIDPADDQVMYASFESNYKLIGLSVENKTLPTVIGDGFFTDYASQCQDLLYLGTPDVSNVTKVKDSFMSNYAYSCYKLLEIQTPDIGNITSAGNNFLNYYSGNTVKLTSLIVKGLGRFKTHQTLLNIPTDVLGTLKVKVKDPAELAEWKELTQEGRSLYINYVRDEANVVLF